MDVPQSLIIITMYLVGYDYVVSHKNVAASHPVSEWVSECVPHSPCRAVHVDLYELRSINIEGLNGYHSLARPTPYT